MTVSAATTSSKDGFRKFRYWQNQSILAAMIGYAGYYFVRKNLSLAMTAMQLDPGTRKSDSGLFLNLHRPLHSIPKSANGYLGDRTNTRYFMIAGRLLSAAADFAFELSSAVFFSSSPGQPRHMATTDS